MSNPFTEQYYLNGPASGLSNYVNYQWLPDETIPACQKIVRYLGCNGGDSILDIGAARGYYVRALRMIGYEAFGVDISEWAVNNCHELVKDYMSTAMPDREFDWAIGKDCLEHIPFFELTDLITKLNDNVKKGMLFIVPLAKWNDGPYEREEDENDSTHVIRWEMDRWISFFENNAPKFNVNASFHIHGIKPASQQVRHSCGFFTLIRP